jgi:3-hydroxyisobutyrate dehydrogenase-like beta-hydroxyacid dehydrogenase
MSETIGIIGLGRMGLPMGRRLVEAGYEVVGFDTSAEAQKNAAEAGISVVASAAEVAAASDASMVIVGFDDEVTATVLGEGGLLEGARQGHAVFICSTVRPDTVRALQGPATERGVDVLDATLCRAEHAAVDGTLLIMTGGPEDVASRWRPMLDHLGTDVYHLGELGAGQVGKMINNQLLWVAVVANWEGLRLGVRLGVDQDALRAALEQSSGNNWALETWGKSRPMPWAEKDLSIVLDYAQRVGLEMPASRLAADEIAAIKKQKAAWVEGGGAASAMSDFLEAAEKEGQPA